MIDKRLVILGGGESGVGAARLAKKKGYARVFLSESKAISEDRKIILNSLEIDYEEGKHSFELLSSFDLVVKSPGIPNESKIVQFFVTNNVPLISEIEFGFQHLEEGHVIAITGTNGKTTCTSLTHHLLKNAGLHVAIGGNIGNSFASLVAEGGYSHYVIEVSSFQLDDIVTFRPNISVLLNITPDHLDRYNHDFGAYVKAKLRIVENASEDDYLIYYNESEPITNGLKKKIKASTLPYSLSDNSLLGAYIDNKKVCFHFSHDEHRIQKIPLEAFTLTGKHNLANSMAACLVGFGCDISKEDIVDGLKTFLPIPHRMQWVGEKDGVAFINDSKATNVDAVYYALEGIQEEKEIVWMAGGIDKGNDYEKLIPLVERRVKALICLGNNNKKLMSYFGHVVPHISETTSMEEATSRSFELSREGDAILLSPACASFDLFKSFEDRGNQFIHSVNKIIRTEQFINHG